MVLRWHEKLGRHCESSRNGFGPGVLFVLLISFLLGGCASSAAVRPTDSSAVAGTVGVVAVLVRDEVHSRDSNPVPEELLKEISAALKERGIEVLPLGDLGFDEAVVAQRTTPGRLKASSQRAGQAPLLLLVETRATFYSQLSGRYRWTVDARLTLAPSSDLGRALASDIQVPAFLIYDHQREDDAISQAARLIARQAGDLADQVMMSDWPELQQAIGAPLPPVQEKNEGSQPAKGSGADSQWRPAPPPSGDTLYFAMVDRFARQGQDKGSKGNPASLKLQDFWGGTVNGLRERLDWLDELGVGTLWISPVYLSREESFHGWGAFHGYWVEDHMAAWPRLGSFDDLKGLSSDLRARNMRLLLDVVVNHVGYDAPLIEQKPEWFNRRGAIEDWNCPEQIVYGDVHGLPDLNQEDPEVYDYLLEHAKLWIERVRPDGFRLDAVKHVPLSFWRKFNAEMKAFAGEDFYLLGEDMDGDPARVSHTLREGGFDALFDFPVHFALVDVFCREAPVGRLAAILSMDHLYGEGVGHRMVTFLDNHDLPRILSVCDNDHTRVAQALAAMVGLRGTPAITWGTEVGLDGADEPENRAPMTFEQAHPAHETVRRALDLRSNNPRLLEADTVLKRLDSDVLVLIRLTENPVVLAINKGEEPTNIALSALSGLKGRSLLDGTKVGGDGFYVPANSVELVELQAGSGDESWQKFISSLSQEGGTTSRPGAPRVVEVRVRKAPSGRNGQLVMVGAGDALGGWNPAKAVRFDGDSVQVSLPTGLVAEYKLALTDETDTRWEEGPNRHLLVPPGDESIKLELTWRQES